MSSEEEKESPAAGDAAPESIAEPTPTEQPQAESTADEQRQAGASTAADERPPPRWRWLAEPLAFRQHRLVGTWPRHLLAMLGLVAVTCLLYGGALDLGFFSIDDPDYIVNNTWIRSLSAEDLQRILWQPYFANYSPLHLLSYSLDYAIGELDPKVYHWSSALWAGAGAAMVYLLGTSLARSQLAGLLAGLLFVCHPGHVEAVAWLSSRKDLVAVVFAVPAMFLWLRYLDSRGPLRWAWYLGALVLFILGIAGKQSVIVVPGMLFLYEFFCLQRRNLTMWLDKLPCAAAVLFFALRVMDAQPETRQTADIAGLGIAYMQNLWLLSGFGEQVIFRSRPVLETIGQRWLYGGSFVLLVAVPLLACRRLPPMVVVFAGWLLLAILPPQVLAFLHPVTDRYLYFPSTVVTICIAWLAVKVSRRLLRTPHLATVVLLVLAGFWAKRTLDYLAEWRDPRSLWYAAKAKSQDVNPTMYLGAYYQRAADELAVWLAADDRRRETARELAKIVWADDDRLSALEAEWQKQPYSGPVTKAYQKHLRDLARAELYAAQKLAVGRVMPNLYYRLAKLEMDAGNFAAAFEGFQKAYDESRKHTSIDVRQTQEVMCLFAMGVAKWNLREYTVAHQYILQAEAAQQRAGKAWVPDISEQRRRLELLLPSQL